MRIEGARVLVTGASSGIGAALAPLLASRGATVGIAARRGDRLAEVAARCAAHGAEARHWVADLGDLDRAEAVAREASDAFGGIDVLVNNAAIPRRVPVGRLTSPEVEETLRVDFLSPVRMTLALLPEMLARGSGLVVNVSSMGGRLGIAGEAAYCAAKFALCGWSEAMRIDLEGSGVDVKLVLPGPVDTEIWDLPGNDPAVYDGPLVAAEEAAAGIADAIAGDGFEHYVPESFAGIRQHDVVTGKTADVDGFLAAMAAMAAAGDRTEQA